MKILGVELRGDRPMPAGDPRLKPENARLQIVLAGLKPGKSFDWPTQREPYRAAHRLGIRIKTKKQNGGGFIVWRKQ
jgi:hypothetical protein